jgi:hypothetical protein
MIVDAVIAIVKISIVIYCIKPNPESEREMPHLGSDRLERMSQLM